MGHLENTGTFQRHRNRNPCQFASHQLAFTSLPACHVASKLSAFDSWKSQKLKQISHIVQTSRMEKQACTSSAPSNVTILPFGRITTRAGMARTPYFAFNSLQSFLVWKVFVPFLTCLMNSRIPCKAKAHAHSSIPSLPLHCGPPK